MEKEPEKGLDPQTESQDIESQEDGTVMKPFRLNSGTLFLTYSQCPLPIAYVKERLDQLLPVAQYIVAQETHQDGGLHIHAYLRLEKKIDRKVDPRFLDIDGYHPNIRSCRSPKAVQAYCTKEGNYLTNMKLMLENPYLEASKLAREGKVPEALEMIQNLKPRDMVLYGSRIRTHMLEQRRAFKKKTIYFTISDYEELPIWDRSKTLILSGLTGCGKTQLAKILLPNHMLIRHLDGTKDFNEGIHDGIIFDDMTFIHIPREAQIHLVDVSDDSLIHARHTCGFIPAGTPRIITTNKKFDEVLLRDDAIVRRVVWWEILGFADKTPGDGQLIEAVETTYLGLGTISSLPRNSVNGYRWN